MKVDKAHGIALGVVFAALAVYNNPPTKPFEWGDYLMFGLLGLLLWWLLAPRPHRGAVEGGHEGARDSLAFRLGKAFNSVIRRKSI